VWFGCLLTLWQECGRTPLARARYVYQKLECIRPPDRHCTTWRLHRVSAPDLRYTFFPSLLPCFCTIGSMTSYLASGSFRARHSHFPTLKGYIALRVESRLTNSETSAPTHAVCLRAKSSPSVPASRAWSPRQVFYTPRDQCRNHPVPRHSHSASD
jgi:hypothetical protein